MGMADGYASSKATHPTIIPRSGLRRKELPIRPAQKPPAATSGKQAFLASTIGRKFPLLEKQAIHQSGFSTSCVSAVYRVIIGRQQ
jgi:hypothetical protein